MEGDKGFKKIQIRGLLIVIM